MGIPNLLLYATPAFLVAMLIEYLISKKRGLKSYTKSDTTANFEIAIGCILIGGLASSYGLSMYYFSFTIAMPLRHQLLGIDSLGWSWYIWLLAIPAEDLTYYWFHRLSHQIRILWACHIVHHSSLVFNYSTAIRNGWFAILYKPFFYIWMAILGFHPFMIATCISINAFYQFFCHSSFRYSWKFLENILCTPNLHAIHHSKCYNHIDKNFAGIFILYDKLFNTYYKYNANEVIKYGVTIPPENDTIQEILLHELKNIYRDIKVKSGWKNKWPVLLKFPTLKAD